MKGQKQVTIKDIAKRLNVSVSTISRALKDNPEISLKTRDLVKKVAKEMNYRPNPIAVALKTSKSNIIGVIVPKIVSSFYASVVEGIEEVADQHGYQIFVSSTNEDFVKERKYVDAFIRNRADGVIMSLSRSTEDYSHIQELKNMNIPTVLFERTTKDLDVPRVVTDDSKAAYKAVKHLIEVGARDIAFLTGAEHLLLGRNRMRGYKNALADFNLEFDPTLVVRCNMTAEDAQNRTQMLINSGKKFDAIFCLNDDLAIGAMQAAKASKLKIPKDVAIVGFYNSQRSHFIQPALTTVELNPRQVGILSAGLLFEQINDEETEIKELIVPSNLIIRGSSRG